MLLTDYKDSHTVWKFKYFSAIQIFGELKLSMTGVLTILALRKAKNSLKPIFIGTRQNCQYFDTPNLQKMISRKI